MGATWRISAAQTSHGVGAFGVVNGREGDAGECLGWAFVEAWAGQRSDRRKHSPPYATDTGSANSTAVVFAPLTTTPMRSPGAGT